MGLSFDEITRLPRVTCPETHFPTPYVAHRHKVDKDILSQNTSAVNLRDNDGVRRCSKV